MNKLLVLCFLVVILAINSSNGAEDLNLKAKKEQKQTEPVYEKRYHLKWITGQTQFPIWFEKPVDEDISYNWYKYDQENYITHLPKYRHDFYSYREQYKTKLIFFGYDKMTHNLLTTYEPKPLKNQPTHEHSISIYRRDFYSMIFLKNVQIKIDRDVLGERVNVSCYADFLVDEKSIDVDHELIKQMKQLAVIKLDLKRPVSKANVKYTSYLFEDKSVPKQQEAMLNRWDVLTPLLKSFTRKNWADRLEDEEDREDISLIETVEDEEKEEYDQVQDSKRFMNVRLALGPVQLKKPFRDEMISCNLDLVNADDVNLDYHHKIYRYLTQENRGFDHNDDDNDYRAFEVDRDEPADKETTTTTIKPTSTIKPEVSTSTEKETPVFVPKNKIENHEKPAIVSSNKNDDLILDVMIEESKKGQDEKMTDEEKKKLGMVKSKFLFLVDKPTGEQQFSDARSNISNLLTVILGVLIFLIQF